MENWGLVTYREVDLLCDPLKASNQQKQRVCTVVTHELAHQWFGNLVTMAWWDDLWLNEGFASWAENWCADEIYPNYKMWDQFTTGHLSAAMRLDAMKSSHPIQVPIAHAEEVSFSSHSCDFGVCLACSSTSSKHITKHISRWNKFLMPFLIVKEVLLSE
jgi:aminopeptidase N